MDLQLHQTWENKPLMGKKESQSVSNRNMKQYPTLVQSQQDKKCAKK